MEHVKKKIGFIIPNKKNRGLGHLIRCIRIIDEIKTNYEFFFFLKKKFPINIELLTKKKINIVNIKNTKNTFKNILKVISSENIETIIIDDYDINFEKQKKLKSFTKKLIIIDDLVNRKVYCDYYINYKFDQKDTIKKNLINNGSKFKKIILGEKFWFASKDLKKKKVKNKKKIVSISFGNSFDFNKIKVQLSYLLNYCTDFKFQIFLGYYCKNYEYLKEIAKKSNSIRLFTNKIFIEKILSNSDIFLGAAGNSIYEMSYLNIPSIFFTMAHNQSNEIKSCEKLGHFFIVDIKDLDKKNLAKFLKVFSKNYLRIKRLNLKKTIILNKLGLPKTLKLCKI